MIYEGDLVRVTDDYEEPDIDTIIEVKWSNEGCYSMRDDMGGDYIPMLGADGYELEVIGNIYERPSPTL